MMGATITGKRTWFSGLSNTQCQLIFTNKRIIVARTVGQISDPLGKETYWVVTDAGKLKGLDFERTLQSDEKNFAIGYDEIERIEVGMKWRNCRANVHTRTGVHRFMWTWPTRLESVQNSLSMLLPRDFPVNRVDKLD